MKKIKHTCSLDCSDCCTFEIILNNNHIEKILGDKEHPYTKGVICKKGLAHLDRLKHKNRLYSPLLKTNGVWEKISFNSALDIIVERLKLYKDKYSSKSILYYEQYGNGTVLKSIGDVFFNFYGGVSRDKGGPCWSAGMKAQKLDMGDARSNSLDDMLNSKNIFVWGKNPANTSIHTLQMIKTARDNGAKVIVIDPICTNTTKFADKYIRVNPGKDGELALAMGKIIIEENLYNKEYIDSYVNGFDEYLKYVKSLSIKDLCCECGVNENEIRELVTLYTNKYSTILLGYGIQKYYNGGSTVRLIDALGAITGQIGFSGGGINYANKVYPDILNLDPYNSKENADNREFYVSYISDFINDSIEGETYYLDNIFTKRFPITQNHNITKMNIPVKMAVITKSNLLNQLPNLKVLEDAFSKIDFKVCFDMFITDTANACDLIIPCTNTLESEDLIFSSMNNPYISYNEKIIKPENPLMDEYYFFMELAKRLDIKDYPMVSKTQYLSKVIEPLKSFNDNISLDWLGKNPYTIHKKVSWEDKRFATKSGKFEIISPKPRSYDKKLCDYDENKTQRFRLLTNHHRDSLSSQHFLDEDKTAIGYINDNMSKKLNLINEQVVTIKSENGSIKIKLLIDNMVADNIIMMYVGWWKKHGNPNFLTNSGISDIGGQITYNETFVEVIK